MTMRPKLQWLTLAALCALGSTTVGCAGGSERDLASSEDSVTEVPHSSVKDQSADNCWIYATTGWIESMHLAATGEELNLSESYLTYWHFYDQITAGLVTGGVVEEGGSWGEAADLIRKYGMMAEKDFIPAEADEILSERQAKAVIVVNKALKSGELRSGAARRNPALVRDVLDKAWKLKAPARGYLDKTFGPETTLTIEKDYVSVGIPAGVPIFRAVDLKANLKNPETGRINQKTALDAIGTHKSTENIEHRNGDFAWQDVAYPKTKPARRAFWKRVQHALNDHQPVIVNWTLDFAAFTADGKFADVPARPGSQGGHMVLGYDYAVDNVPGFGSLEAGVNVTDPRALEASLDDAAEVRFLRVKNSWSPTYHPLAAPAPGGYHDLYVKYLNGPMPFCNMDAKDKPIMSTCEPGIPLDSIVLPAGY